MQHRASRAFPELFAAAHRLQQSGRVAEAIGAYQEAIAADDGVAEAHNNLACAFLTLGRWDDGTAALERAVALRPDYAAALDNLGVTRSHAERFDEALELHNRAAALDPANATIHNHLGDALLGLGRIAEARAAFEHALQLAPAYAAARNGLGVALDQLGDLDAATAAFRDALEADPQLASAAANLGKALVKTGDIEEARHWFERAIRIEPRNANSYWSLVDNSAGVVADTHIAAMEGLAREIDSLDPPRRVELHFALGRTYEHLGRYDDAFRHLHAGNALKRATLHYAEAAHVQFIASLEQTFTASFVAALRGGGNPSARPIFVFGMPRSGTTLVEQLLAAQPAVRAGGEHHEFEHAVNRHVMAPQSSGDELAARIRALGDGYLNATDALAGDAAHLTDKLPHNFCFAPLIHLALPNARMIHVRRDRLDTCFSCYATLFAEASVPYAYDLGELARYYAAYERVMAAWRAILPPDRFIEVEYERLVADFEGEARRLLAFCELPWSAATLAFHRVRGTVRTASAAQVRQPLYARSVGRSRPFAGELENARSAPA